MLAASFCCKLLRRGVAGRSAVVAPNASFPTACGSGGGIVTSVRAPVVHLVGATRYSCMRVYMPVFVSVSSV